MILCLSILLIISDIEDIVVLPFLFGCHCLTLLDQGRMHDCVGSSSYYFLLSIKTGYVDA